MNSDIRTDLTDLVGCLAFAGDLTMGQPLEHSPRTAWIAAKIADAAGLSLQDQRASVVLSLIRWSGCTSNGAEFADILGDDIQGRADLISLDPRRSIPAHLQPRLEAEIAQMSRTHCEVGKQFADALALGPLVGGGMSSLFEHWDGSGAPGDRAGDAIALPARVTMLAGDVEILSRTGGRQIFESFFRNEGGRRHDPQLSTVAVHLAGVWFDAPPQGDPWTQLKMSNLLPDRLLHDDALVKSCEALADFADFRLPRSAGLSRRIAALTAATARNMGWGGEAQQRLRCAALLHGLGRAAVGSRVFGSQSIRSVGDCEALRLVPYWTERCLSRAGGLNRLSRLAGSAFERRDGSGYHRSIRAPECGVETQVLAACVALLSPDAAMADPAITTADITALRAAVDRQQFDSVVVEAVVAAFEGRRSDPPSRGLANSDLTDRELDVLLELALGKTNKEIAQALALSPKTVGTHIEHVYAKLNVSTRAAATLRAVQLGLLA